VGVAARTDPGLAWLLGSSDPAVRFLARRDLLGEPGDQAEVLASPWVRALLRFEDVHPYRKWRGAHWRLVSLVELGLPAGQPAATAACERVLEWLVTAQRYYVQVAGRIRQHASIDGNAIAVACRLGLGAHPHVRRLRDGLLASQWPDGGWNCDPRPEAAHSSFHETLATLWGLAELGDPESRAAAARACELLLRHGVFRSLRTGRPVHPEWVRLHYPPYWHYDVLQALLVLGRAGALPDPRAAEALEVVSRARGPEGTWRPSGLRYWRASTEAVDWGGGGPHEMLTLNALRVLAAAS
jgi:hypothetical protein